MDDRTFDDVTRRLGALPLSRLPRRGALALLGGTTLAASLRIALGDAGTADARQQDRKKNNNNNKKNNNKNKNKKKCKKEGKRCDRNKDCCKGKCQGGTCSSGANCRTGQDLNKAWGSNGNGNGQFKDPWGISVDKNGDVYVVDRVNDRVQVFDANGNYKRQWGQPGTAREQFVEARGIAVNDDSAYVSDPGQSDDRTFRKFSKNGSWQSSLAPGSMTNPFGVDADVDGNIWVIDTNGRVYLFDSNGRSGPVWQPGGDGDLSGAEGIAVWIDEKSNRTFVYVARTAASSVVKLEYVNNSSDGLQYRGRTGSFGTGSNQFKRPADLAVDKCGNLWVSDTLNNRIQKLDKDLKFRSSFTAGLNNPTGIALNSGGTAMYVVDSGNSRVVKFDLK
jgi:tripartite motif-containing protein 71